MFLPASEDVSNLVVEPFYFQLSSGGDSITSCGKRRVCVNKPAVVLRVVVWFANINSLKPKGVCF